LPDVRELYDSAADSLSDEELESKIAALQQKGLFEIKSEYLNDDFLKDLQSDIELLKSIQDDWKNIDSKNDPKLIQFAKILKEKIKKEPNRKIIVFSQFADTINYLNEQLKNDLPIFAYTSSQANETNKTIINTNFDAGCPENRQKDDYKILLATDAISEGYNLHRAGTIFNYDIPYNPTRVIQRIGRINRINKKMFAELSIYNYFPTAIGEKETRIKAISTLKMAMIHAIMGEDTKVLTKEEELQHFFVKQYKDLIKEDEKVSWDTEYRIEFDSVKNSDDMKQALNLPLRSKVRRMTSLPQEGILVFARKGKDLVYKISTPLNEPQDIPPQEAFALLKTNKDEKSYPVSNNFEEIYDEVKKSLFATDAEKENEKTKRDALDKITAIQGIANQSHNNGAILNADYLEDLKKAVEFDTLSGFALRKIKRLKTTEYETLPEIISHNYIRRVLHTYDTVFQGTETLILAEEIQSNYVNTSDTNLLN
jgi:superfamily II DNA/RNA helicase